mmetsp:Transcript_29850/g.97204  ORF Transcript_29850/g.97204 Transcript_29850/m.97204 type:complete len:113 (-) Transcript_29850:470-808(-)
MVKVDVLMAAYAGALYVSGSVAPALAWGREAGVSMLVSAWLSRGTPKKGEDGFVAYMAAVHFALILPVGYAAGYAYRWWRSGQKDSHAAGMAALSVAACALLAAQRPPKKTD